MKVPGKYRSDIDGLRAIAVLGIIGFHAFPEWIKGGFIGVDIFFVISGFLITQIILEDLQKGDFHYEDFYIRRIRRIFPALLVLLSVCLITGYFFLIGVEYKQLGQHIAGGAAFISNIILWNEAGYFDNQAQTKPLLHLWSLGVEGQFYIFWPYILCIAAKNKRNILMVISFLVALSFGFTVFTIESYPVGAFYLPFTRLWEFMLGAIIAYFSLRKTKIILDNIPWLSEVGLVFIIGGIILINEARTFPGWWALLPTIGAMLVISAGPRARLNTVLLSNPWMVRIGLISYPLYLWHWPLLSFAHIILSHTPSYGFRLILIFSSFILAELTYRLEKKIRSVASPFDLAVVLCVLMICIGYAGLKVSDSVSLTHSTRPAYTQLQQSDGAEDAYTLALKKYSAILAGEPNYLARLEEERKAAVRYDMCQMMWDMTDFEGYLGKIAPCFTLIEGKKNVLIMGDSHAADLYRALSLVYPDIHFLQATGDLCFPALLWPVSSGQNKCYRLFEKALDSFKNKKPDAIILEAAWFFYGDYRQLTTEIIKLKSEGEKVILVGPPVRYSEDVFKIIARRPGDTDFKPYMDSFIMLNAAYESHLMKIFAHDLGISYIDRIAYFCKNGCPVLDANGNLLIYDYGHLTTKGSEFLGNQLLQDNALIKILTSAAPLSLPETDH